MLCFIQYMGQNIRVVPPLEHAWTTPNRSIFFKHFKPRASEREGYTICYISGCDHATLGMSEQFNIKEIQDDNLTEQWLRRENHAEDSTNKVHIKINHLDFQIISDLYYI